MADLDYRALFEAAPSLFLVLNPAFEIVAVNHAYLKATMTERSQILGKQIFDAFPDNPEDPAADGVRNLRASLERVVLTKRFDAMPVQKYDIQRPAALGGGFEVRYWSPVNSPVLGENGEVISIIHRVEDVTEFARLQAALRSEAENTAAERTRAEHMATEVMARSRQLGEANRQLKVANQGLADLYKEAAALVATADAELKLGGTLPLAGGEAPELDPEEILKQIKRLITGHRQLEAELRQAQKMEAVGQLAGGIAHDFNNILTVILGYCNLLLARVSAQDPIYRKLTDIRWAGEKAAELTRQLLIFSRRQVVEPKVVNLAATIDEMDRMFRRVIGEDVEIASILDKDIGRVKIDPSQIQQVMMNLVVNARDAMPDGGKLTIELKNESIEEGTPHFDVPAGEYVSIAVTDTGSGMTPEVRQRVFEPFFTTKGPGQGTGLGLSTVYGIIKQAQGHIWVYSEPGNGTTFRTFLPRVDEVPEAEPATTSTQVLKGSETILVVEDDHLIRSLIREILTDNGYVVLAAGLGQEALQLCQNAPGKIDLLLTDVVLPQMSGKEIAFRVQKMRPDVKTIFMSGYTGDAMARGNAPGEPKGEFLQKPFTPDVLCKRIRAVLDSSISHTPRLLVIDEVSEVRALISAVIEDAGFLVLNAHDGRDAREKAEGQALDVILADFSYPAKVDLATLKHLREINPQAKLVAMSAAFGADVLELMSGVRVDARLAKPLRPESLVACIRGLVST